MHDGQNQGNRRFPGCDIVDLRAVDQYRESSVCHQHLQHLTISLAVEDFGAPFVNNPGIDAAFRHPRGHHLKCDRVSRHRSIASMNVGLTYQARRARSYDEHIGVADGQFSGSHFARSKIFRPGNRLERQ